MGHVNGRIADVVFENAALHDGLAFHVDAHGSYVRRRLVPSPETQAEARLLKRGKRMVFGEVMLRAEGAGEVSAHVTTSWAVIARSGG